jgi:hypothetical protein
MTLSATALVTLVEAKNFLRIDHAASLRRDAEYVGVGTGSLVTFTLDYTPVSGSLQLYVNNVLQTETTHYSISTATITMVTAPGNGVPVTATYDYAASANTFESYDDALLERLIEAATKEAEDATGRAFVQRTVTESHIGDGTETLRLYKWPVESITSVAYERLVRKVGDGTTVAWDLGYTPKSGSLTVYKDGVLLTVTTDYTLSSQTVTFVATPADDAELIFRFQVSSVLGSDYEEQIAINRLTGLWWKGYEYVVVYTAGSGATVAAAQTAFPDAVMAVLLIISDMYENRGDRVDSESVTGLGSVSYKMPSRAAERLARIAM